MDKLLINKEKSKRTNAQNWHRIEIISKIFKIFYINDIIAIMAATEYILLYNEKKEKYEHLAKFSYGNINPWKVYQRLDADKYLSIRMILSNL